MSLIVGRGLRLAVVDSQGKRQTIKHCGEDESAFYNVNTLDVIVPRHEKDFIEGIQNEILENSINRRQLTIEALQGYGLTEFQINRLIVWLEDNQVISPCKIAQEGLDIESPIADFLEANKNKAHSILAPVLDGLIKVFKKANDFSIKNRSIENRNKPLDTISIRKNKFKEFEDLWRTIISKTKIIYRNIDDDELIKKNYDHRKNQIITDKEESLENLRFFTNGDYIKLIQNFSDKEELPLSFYCALFSKLDKNKIKKNPIAQTLPILSKANKAKSCL